MAYRAVDHHVYHSVHGSWSGAIKCHRKAPAASVTERCSANSACFGCVRDDMARRRVLGVKPVGERSAGNPHAAFDERGRETGPPVA